MHKVSIGIQRYPKVWILLPKFRHGLLQEGNGTCLPARASAILLAEESSFKPPFAKNLPRCLGDSGLPKSKISDVVLVGGSTRALDFDDVLIDSDGATKVNHGAMLSSVMVVAQQG